MEVLGVDIPGWDDWALGRIGQRSGFFPLPYVERIEGVAAVTSSALASVAEGDGVPATEVADEDTGGQSQAAVAPSNATEASTAEEKSAEQLQVH